MWGQPVIVYDVKFTTPPDRSMAAVSAEQIVIEAGRSAALDQVFRTVAETDLGAGPKYGPAVLRDLARTVSARAYGRPMFELCHLIRIAEAADRRHGWPALIFDLPVARPAAFRGRLQGALAESPDCAADFEQTADGIEIRYPDRRFRVTYGRMPFLAALAELLVTALGYRSVDAVFREWLSDGFDCEPATRHASALSKALYDYLREHVPGAQAQRSFRSLIRFLEASRGSDFTLDDVDDRAVLDYWRSADAGDGRTFRGAAEQMARLRSALEAGFERRAVDRAAAIGGDRAAGEIDPELIATALEAHDAPGEPLRALALPPAAAVKFLNRREAEELEAVARFGRQAPWLPMSVLRAATFGPTQARLTQAARRQEPDAVIDGLACCRDTESYDACFGRWGVLDRHLRRVALAALAILLEAGRAEGLVELMAEAPDADLVGLRSGHADPGSVRVADILGSGALAAFAARLADPAVAGAPAAALVEESQRQLRGLSRRGFGSGDRDDPEVLDGLASGAPLVRALREALSGLVARARSAMGEPGPGPRFAEDVPLFAERFRILYGRAS